jgi:tripartite-type tricarboxylate transporter receptor subunit TctC
MHFHFRLALVLGLFAAADTALAQAFPTKPVRIMVPASPGGRADVIARMAGEKFAEGFTQPLTVDNRPGASNTIAADLTANAAPYGCTLPVSTNTGQSIAPHLIRLGRDPLKGLRPISPIVIVPNVLIVNPAVPAGDVKDQVALVKSRPNELQYASSGVGSTQHIAGKEFAMAAGINAVHDTSMAAARRAST